MNADSPTSGRPAWARPDLFPAVPPGSWGYLSGEQGPVIVPDEEVLQQIIREDVSEKIGLVWTPELHHMEVPEAVSQLQSALKESRTISSEQQLKRQTSQLRMWLLLYAGFMAFTAWEIIRLRGSFSPILIIRDLIATAAPALGLLLVVMFSLMPWYDAKKRWREVRSWTQETMRDAADLARFEAWLGWQKIFATKVLMGLIAITGAVQVLSGNPYAAALLRDGGERWRLLTAPMLHGNMLHFIMNALGLMYLGRRIEALARWPQVPIVFLFSAWLGGECSMMMSEGASLGASGGIMGMLGFLLVFEIRHTKLVPRKSRRRLVVAVLGTALIGLIGIRFIDNAAHAGGLIAGMIYALVVFPRSESVMRPQASAADRLVGLLCFAVIGYGSLLAIQAMID